MLFIMLCMFLFTGGLFAQQGPLLFFEPDASEPAREEPDSDQVPDTDTAWPVDEPEAADYPVLSAGRTVQGLIDTRDGQPYQTWRFDVPAGATRVILEIGNSAADLDLYVNSESYIHSYAEAEYRSVEDDYNEVLVIDRFSTPALREGLHYLDVAYQRTAVPQIPGQAEGVIPYSITYRYEMPVPRAVLKPGVLHKDRLEEKSGMFALYAVEVPRFSSALRVDITGSNGDIDLLASANDPGLSPSSYQYKSETLASREYLVIRPDSGSYLESGTWYLMVYDRVSRGIPVDFSVIVSMSDQAPAVILGIPALSGGDTPLERSLAATVSITGLSSRGSGVLVSSDGFLLTNWHVVRGDDGNPLSDVVVAVNRNLIDVPDELFRAVVVKHDEHNDLALLKIVSGYYGQKLPDAYQFPYFAINTDAVTRIGQPVSIIGFPDVGGAGARVSVTLSRGIISGKTRFYDGYLYKTDAEISYGNSGGAAINVFHELIGLPTNIIGDASGKIGFIHPVRLLPHSWLLMIDGSR